MKPQLARLIAIVAIPFFILYFIIASLSETPQLKDWLAFFAVEAISVVTIFVVNHRMRR